VALHGRGGLRARILSAGVLRVDGVSIFDESNRLHGVRL